MKFSIIHPTARPDKWKDIYHAWREAAHDRAVVEYILVCDKRWKFEHLPVQTIISGPSFEFKAVWNDARRCYVDAVNIGASYATGDVLIVIADDQFPCENWDVELEKVITKDPTYSQDAQIHSNFVVEVSTGTPAEHDRGIMVMPILSRPRYESKGRVFFPLYESMYADNDFCEEARADDAKNYADGGGVILNARDLMFPHRHPIFDATQAWDQVYEAQNRREAYKIGEGILARRRAAKFNGIADSADPVQSATGRKVFAIAAPGETFSQAWVQHWTELVTWLASQFDVRISFGHTSIVYFARQAIFDGLQALNPRPDFTLWLDDDQILSLEGLKTLIADLEQNSELDGVFGWAWCEPSTYGNNAPRLSCGILTDQGPRRLEYPEMMAEPDDLIPVAYSGFPAALFRGRIYDIEARAFMPIHDEDMFPPYGMSGEDTAFCFNARAQGFKLAVDRRVKVPHLKLRCAEPTALTSLENRPLAEQEST